MKKILFILTLLIMCISCDSFNRIEEEQRQQRIEDHMNNTTDLEENFYNVRFDGHLYVVYKEQDVCGLGTAMVHSPNCECNKVSQEIK